MPIWLIVLIVLVSIIFVIGALACLLWLRLPLLSAKKMRAGDKSETKFPENFDDIKNQITSVKNLEYPSAYPSNKFDLYYPNNINQNQLLPVLVWVHGGGFIGGVKEGIQALASIFASKGYGVICIDYAVAPEYRYPTAVIQVNDIFKHLPKLKKDYPFLNLDNLFLGGDSAGGHIASQFTAAITNKNLRDIIKIDSLVSDIKLKGLILISAPTVTENMLPPINFKLKLLQKIWYNGYYGFSAKKRKAGLIGCNVLNFVSADYPPVYTTDGNTYSFETQNRKFAEKLREFNVECQELYFDKETYGTVNHEYVFEMDSEKSPRAIDEMLEFLKLHQ